MGAEVGAAREEQSTAGGDSAGPAALSAQPGEGREGNFEQDVEVLARRDTVWVRRVVASITIIQSYKHSYNHTILQQTIQSYTNSLTTKHSCMRCCASTRSTRLCVDEACSRVNNYNTITQSYNHTVMQSYNIQYDHTLNHKYCLSTCSTNAVGVRRGDQACCYMLDVELMHTRLHPRGHVRDVYQSATDTRAHVGCMSAVMCGMLSFSEIQQSMCHARIPPMYRVVPKAIEASTAPGWTREHRLFEGGLGRTRWLRARPPVFRGCAASCAGVRHASK